MYINERYSGLRLTETAPFTQLRSDGSSMESTGAILKEHLLDIYINDVLTMKLVCIPELLAELTLGRLLTEGMIRGADDVEGIYICEYGKRAKVILNAREPSGGGKYVGITPSCCTGNRILNDYFTGSDEISPVTPIPWKASWIFRLAGEFSKDTPLHRETTATHSCYLARGEEILFQCEDIGRHNALDKAIGYALRNGIDLSGCIAYTSGRVPTDMAVKAVRAGIPILVSKAAVSAEAILLAKEYGLTLIGSARRDGMKLYTGAGPVDGDRRNASEDA